MKRYLAFVVVFVLCCKALSADTWTQLPMKPAGQTGAGGEGWQKGFDCKYAPSDADIVYRVNDTSGVWKSIDGGATWNPKLNGFRFYGGSSIAVYPTNPDIVLVAGSHMLSAADTNLLSESGIARTIDGGQNWTTATSTTNGTSGAYLNLYFSRETNKTQDLIKWVGGASATAYAGTYAKGILKSQDYGYTWSVLVPNSTTGQIYDIDLRGTGTGQNKIVVACANGLLQFTDSGVPSSTNIGTGISGTVRAVEVQQTNINNIYALTSSTLYKSTGTTTSFSTSGIDDTEFDAARSTGATARDLRLSPADANKLFINWTDNGVPSGTPYSYWYYTTDGGTTITTGTGTWDADGTVALFGSAFETAQIGHRAGTFIACHPTNSSVLLVQNGYEQTLKSTNSGQTFTYSNSGYTGYGAFPYKSKNAISFIPGSTTVAIVGNDFCWWMSGDGVTWSRKSRPSGGSDDADAIAIEPGTTTPVVLMSYLQTSDSKFYVQKTSNWGSTWSQGTPTSTSGGNGFPALRFHASNTSHVYTKTYKSSNKGVSWTTMSNGVSDIVYNNNDILYSITSSGSSKLCNLRKSTNGLNAVPTFSNFGPSSFSLELLSGSAWNTGAGLAVNNIDTIVYVPAGTSGVYVITNGGDALLKDSSHGLTVDGTSDWNYRLCVTDPNDPNVAYALAYCFPTHRGGGIFRTTNGGTSWTNITSGTGVGNGEMVSMAVNPNNSYLYANGATGWFVWNADAPTIDIGTPTALNWYGTTSASLTVGGTASDADGLSYVNYVLTGDTTGVGTATGTATWSIASLGINTGTTTVTVTAMDTTGNSSNDTITLNRSAIVVEAEEPDMIFPYASSAITIDGSVGESIWGGATAHPINLTIDGVVVGTVSGSVRGLWNENYLFVAVEGTDTTKNNDTGTPTPHLDTSVEVYLDALRNKGSYGADDFHFILPWNQSNFIWETTNKTTGVSSSMSSSANGYVLEIAIPWSLTTVTGTNSTPLGMDFQQNIDIDGGNTRESAKDAFNAENTNYLNVDNLGLIVLGTVTDSGGGGPEVNPPTIEIVSPVASGGTYSTSLGVSDVYGSASDDAEVDHVVWLNQTAGTSGACSGTTQWNKLDLPLQEGTNTIKATAFDTSNNQGTATIDIIRSITTPSILISTPVNNCTDVDGNRVFGTPSTNITITGTAYDVSGIGTVTVSLTGTTTVHVASGTSTWTTTGTVTCTGSNTVSATAFDPVNFQGTDTMKIGNYPVPVTGDALSVTRNSASLTGTVTINDAATTTVCFDYGTTEGVSVGSSSTQTISGTSVTDGLVFWAKLDETSGNAVDITSGNVGTRTGALQNQAGKINKAYYFDGIDDFVNFGDPADGRYDFGIGSFSYGLWVNVATDTTNSDFPIGKGGWGIPPGGYNMELGSGEWSARISNGSDYKAVTFQASPTYNDWKLLYVVVDRIGGVMKGFVNNQQNGTTSLTGWLPGSSTSNSVPLTIVSESGTNYFFRGKVDDVRMYNRALSATEVLAIYNEGVSGRQASVNIPLGSLNKTTQYYYRLASTGNYEATYGEEEGFITLDGGGIVTNGQFARTELWPPYSTRFIKFLKDNALWPIPFKQRIRSTQQHLDLQNNPDDELSELLD